MCHTRIANKWNTTIQTSVLWIFRSHHSDAPWNQGRIFHGGFCFPLLLLMMINFEMGRRVKPNPSAMEHHTTPALASWQLQGLFSYQHSHLSSPGFKTVHCPALETANIADTMCLLKTHCHPWINSIPQTAPSRVAQNRESLKRTGLRLN